MPLTPVQINSCLNGSASALLVVHSAETVWHLPLQISLASLCQSYETFSFVNYAVAK
jgi:hypothetical protein